MFEGVDSKWKIGNLQVTKEGLGVVSGVRKFHMVGRIMIY